jgi:uncharacterized protein involved in exopolysaccharide biosynthesis
MNSWKVVLRRIRYGGRMEVRTRRYVTAAVIGCSIAWGLSIGYVTVSPRSYTSGFVLVLPGTGAGSSLNLPTLGQATSTSSGAFSSPELSPTENYRKILLSERLIAAAADADGEPVNRFPTPKIELADQTKLITVKITGRTPAQAVARADALRTEFQKLLDALRNDEIQTRNTASQAMLVGYKSAVDIARQRLVDYEAKIGLMSVDQYNSIVGGVEHLREILRDVEAKLANQRATVAELEHELGVTPAQANIALVLRSDPLFQALLEQLAKEDAELATLTGTRGDNNPRVVDAQAERATTWTKLGTRAGELTGQRLDLAKLRDLSIHDERGRLFERLIGQVADAAAMAAMQAQLTEQISNEQTRALALSPAASHLDDLKRDVQVAEAVFSSALARIDTSKSDYYASYPLVQTLEMPDLPSRPSSPLPMLAIAGGLAATILILASLVLTWLRIALLQRILKSA